MFIRFLIHDSNSFSFELIRAYTAVLVRAVCFQFPKSAFKLQRKKICRNKSCKSKLQNKFCSYNLQKGKHQKNTENTHSDHSDSFHIIIFCLCCLHIERATPLSFFFLVYPKKVRMNDCYSSSVKTAAPFEHNKFFVFMSFYLLLSCQNNNEIRIRYQYIMISCINMRARWCFSSLFGYFFSSLKRCLDAVDSKWFHQCMIMYFFLSFAVFIPQFGYGNNFSDAKRD